MTCHVHNENKAIIQWMMAERKHSRLFEEVNGTNACFSFNFNLGHLLALYQISTLAIVCYILYAMPTVAIGRKMVCFSGKS